MSSFWFESLSAWLAARRIGQSSLVRALAGHQCIKYTIDVLAHVWLHVFPTFQPTVLLYPLYNHGITGWIVNSVYHREPTDLDLQFFQNRICPGSPGQGFTHDLPVLTSHHCIRIKDVHAATTGATRGTTSAATTHHSTRVEHATSGSTTSADII